MSGARRDVAACTRKRVKMAEQVKVGQIYADKDRRMKGRYVRVMRIEGLYGFCKSCTASGAYRDNAREVRLALTNLQKRFKLAYRW